MLNNVPRSASRKAMQDEVCHETSPPQMLASGRRCCRAAEPAEVIDKLNKEINAVAADPTIKTRLAGLGVDPMSKTPAEFGKFIADETEKWGEVIRAANIKVE
jgi:hypothetical protein